MSRLTRDYIQIQWGFTGRRR